MADAVVMELGCELMCVGEWMDKYETGERLSFRTPFSGRPRLARLL